MWKVPEEEMKKFLGEDLPEGFSLKEDAEFRYLFYGDTQVAVFPSSGVKPKKILKEAELFLKKKSGA